MRGAIGRRGNLRPDIKEAQPLIDQLQRRYVNGGTGSPKSVSLVVSGRPRRSSRGRPDLVPAALSLCRGRPAA